MPKVRFTQAVEGDRTNPDGYAVGSVWWLGVDQALQLADRGVCDILVDDPGPGAAPPPPAAAVEDEDGYDSFPAEA